MKFRLVSKIIEVYYKQVVNNTLNENYLLNILPLSIKIKKDQMVSERSNDKKFIVALFT